MKKMMILAMTALCAFGVQATSYGTLTTTPTYSSGSISTIDYSFSYYNASCDVSSGNWGIAVFDRAMVHDVGSNLSTSYTLANACQNALWSASDSTKQKPVAYGYVYSSWASRTGYSFIKLPLARVRRVVIYSPAIVHRKG